jgi:hypothetical protein
MSHFMSLTKRLPKHGVFQMSYETCYFMCKFYRYIMRSYMAANFGHEIWSAIPNLCIANIQFVARDGQGRNVDTKFEVYPRCSKNMKHFAWECTFHIFGTPWVKFKLRDYTSFAQSPTFHVHKLFTELQVSWPNFISMRQTFTEFAQETSVFILGNTMFGKLFRETFGTSRLRCCLPSKI